MKKQPKSRALDRHSKIQRIYRDSPEAFAAQDGEAEARGLSWTEWAREVLMRASEKAATRKR